MLKTLGTMILRGLRWFGLGLVGLVLLVVAVLMLNWTIVLLTFATMTVELPNGVRGSRLRLEPRVRNSSLRRISPGCFGLSGGYVGGESILRHPERVSQPTAPKSRDENTSR